MDDTEDAVDAVVVDDDRDEKKKHDEHSQRMLRPVLADLLNIKWNIGSPLNSASLNSHLLRFGSLDGTGSGHEIDCLSGPRSDLEMLEGRGETEEELNARHA
ncbi:hypothetical protein PRIPAC_80081 [Pristionchus pacificus]|uniref:Uncharacterized protein n=1 Tax=Pristionchus pacificus TaxID=54126 RepID=A0A2A6CPN2_PRIPA|nr:hypothetical protein PRIPAC_80081 [Pristionchus pacificus]|eukprot:PDM80162.1 hypothetical protein PRIPAC_32741 [Pristionchus pacificus]